jgi:hypothetical protein
MTGLWIVYGVIGAAIALTSAYTIGDANGYTKGFQAGKNDGVWEGYIDGFRACIERTRDAEQTAESEASS